MLDCEIDFSGLNVQAIDVLSDIASSLQADSKDIVQSLEAYQGQIQLISNTVESSNEVLSGLLVILLEGLKQQIHDGNPVTADDCRFLAKVPEILSEYIFIPASKMPDAHLLSHLKNKGWTRPVTKEEETSFLQLLTGDSADNESDTLRVIDENADTGSEPEIERSDLLTDSSDEAEQSVAGLNDAIIEIRDESEAVQGNTAQGNTVQDNAFQDNAVQENEEFDDEVIDLSELSDYVAAEDHNPLDQDQHELKQLHPSETNVLAIVDNAPAAVVDADGSSDTLSSKTESVNSFQLSDDQRELVGLIISELDEVVSEKSVNTADDLPEKINDLAAMAEQIEKISNATELLGLEGLEFVCRCISAGLHTLAADDSKLSVEQRTLIVAWPQKLLSYLHNIAAVEPSAELIVYLKDPVWPEPLTADAEERLKVLLKEPRLFSEEKKLRQDKAHPDDMSLQLPEDVNPELLEGLLQDLPVQSEEFSSAIQNLSEQSNLDYLEIAQRIAHTLKGAGNVVGVKGIANLTHHLEDILEIQSKAGMLPSRLLLTVLIDAADCLETMSEALLGIDEPPDNALDVFQNVLDWANKLDTEGATDASLDSADDIALKQSLSSTETVEPNVEQDSKVSGEAADITRKPVNAENMLRVPASLADELLRLAGENLISTSQIQEYIKTIQGRYAGLKIHNQSLQQLSFDLEHIVDVQGIVSNSTSDRPAAEDDFDPLELDQYHELHSMSRRLVEIAADSIELANVLAKDITQLSGLVINQDRLQKENEKLVLKTRMVPTKTITPRLKRGVKQACRLTGKEADIELLDNDTYMDSEILNSLIEPLMHLLRNSVDHGIETAEERKLANKSSRGSIRLEFFRKGDQIGIDIKDDGKGLNLEKIRHKAVAMGLADSENEVIESNLKKFILHPGFSTSTEVSHVSGRGIGLDVVHNRIRELKGSIDVTSEQGVGCHFLLTLPVSSFSIHSLLVRVRQYIYAFSNRGIEEVLYPGLGVIENIGNETVFKLDDQVYQATSIDTLLNLPRDRRAVDRESRPVLLVKDDSGTTSAVHVQALIDSRDVVVKSMGAYIPKIRGVIGATVLGDGSIASVIDLPELMQSASVMGDELIQNESKVENNPETVRKASYVLVVDDSLSARKSLAQFVQDLGLDVRTARDGLEAVSIIDARKPGLVLVDMEMPGMNGLELTSYIRSNEAVREVPVIMITSRSTDKHRQVAMDKGVNHFMVKPFNEDELASHINSVLKFA